MLDRAGAAGTNKKNKFNSRVMQVLCAAGVLFLSGCTGGFETEPLVEYSTEVRVEGARPSTLLRQLRPGTYLVEVRERDIDLRVGIDADHRHRDLADAYLRHGVHRTVVSLDSAQSVRITLTSIDQRTWRGAAAIRILLWPQAAPDAAPDERLLGYLAMGKASELVAGDDTASWRASIAPLRVAAAHFLAANDNQALAEAEYQRGYVQFNLIHDFDAGRRSAQAALGHFQAAGDATGEARAEVLLALNELNVASGMGADAPRAEQRELIDTAIARARRSLEWFEANDLPSDAMNALNVSLIGPHLLGEFDEIEPVYAALRDRARARGDKFFEAGAVRNLAYIAQRRGNASEAAAMYESVLPLIERDRNPDLYGTMIANLGSALIALGEFDRALVLHSEALGLFSSRGDDARTARELVALAAIQFRSGNVERALATVENALPLYEQVRDRDGEVIALRLAGKAAAELGQHDLALEYLRRAERDDRNATTIERTRVLIAGELRNLGDLRGAEKLLADLMQTKLERTRAHALAERARLRLSQHRRPEALSDLREADSIYARLKLDFNRIDTSAALAMALLDAGDLHGAALAADTAVAIETRIRVKSDNPELRARFLSASYAPYEARIEVDLAGSEPRDTAAVWQAFRTAENVRARSLTDRLAHATRVDAAPHDSEADRVREQMSALEVDLERRLRKAHGNDESVLEVRRLIDETQAQLDALQVSQDGVRAVSGLSIPEDREAAQAMLPPDTAVLAYFVGDQRSHGWLLTRTELKHITLPGRHALENLVKSFVERQRSGDRGTPDATFAPLLGNLLNGIAAHRLLVLPDGPLNGLPFAALALPRGQGREQLIDRYVITTAPSLALALRPLAARPAKQTRVAVISDPVYTPDDRRLTVANNGVSTYRGIDLTGARLARLPYSAIEARAVVRAFQGMNVIELAGFNATARRVIELPFGELGVLHFATHAVAREDAPERSALFLTEFAADGTPLPTDRLTAEDIRRSGLRADVVVLSGCATGDGRELRGEGVLGLAYGFLANGSHSVVATLWPVEDAMTARFMEEFYAAYRAYGNASDALRAAQLRSRSVAGASVWASFVVRSSGIR